MFSLVYHLPKTTSKFFPIEISSKKVRANKLDFSTIKITSKKVRRNNVDFSTIEITSKKVRGSYVDFLTREIIPKKYVETTWIIWPSESHWK